MKIKEDFDHEEAINKVLALLNKINQINELKSKLKNGGTLDRKSRRK